MVARCLYIHLGLLVLLIWGGGCFSKHYYGAVSPPAGMKKDIRAAGSLERDRSRAGDSSHGGHAAGGSAAAPSARSAGANEPIHFLGELGIWSAAAGSSAVSTGGASANLHQVSFTRVGADFDVDVDAEGERLVLASTRHRETADLYLKSVDGRTLTQLTSDPANDVMPAFSPDGSAVAFASDRSGQWDIYILPIEGGKPVRLTSSPAQELHPSWSPDGERIVFSCLGRSGRWEMVLVDAGSGGRRRIIGYGLFPEFSPDGKKIVFQRARSRGGRTFGVWTMDLVDGEGLRPTEIAAAANAALINPTWGPRGERIAFATVVDPPAEPTERPDSAGLWAVRLDGTGRVKLTGDPHANLQPVWAGDGTIYFISDRSEWDNVWALRAEEFKVESLELGMRSGIERWD